MRSRASRRSVSIWLSPGPLVPMPPSMRPAPRRSRWVQRPRMRAMLYSSWASSTCSLPSAEWAWSAKMSRITAVRSITGTPERRLEVALLARRELVVAGDQVGVAGGDLAPSARPAGRGRSSGRGRAAARCWVASPAVATPAVRSSSFSSASGSPLARGRRRCRSPAPAGAPAGWSRRRRSPRVARLGLAAVSRTLHSTRL